MPETTTARAAMAGLLAAAMVACALVAPERLERWSWSTARVNSFARDLQSGASVAALDDVVRLDGADEARPPRAALELVP